jgi:syntaxin-binding protein 1
VLVTDEASSKALDNVVKVDDILNENITNVERIEERREMNPETDAVYILSPQPFTVECLLADLEVGRYKKAYLLWTSLLDPELRRKLEDSRSYAQRRAGFDTIFIDLYPRESHLVTFRDPWSFPILFHPSCNHLVRAHLQKMAQKIMSTCVLLGEYPRVRYHQPREPAHEASVLCHHLARFVQEELDEYAQFTAGFGENTGRPQGVLLITDRSMDLMAPLLHEFTYQAMTHDLLPIKDTDKVKIRMRVNEGRHDAEDKDMELHEEDKVWVDNRHRHMKDTLDKIVTDFNKFIDANAHFAKESSKTNINTIKDMMAGLPQFQAQKEAYSLHIDMAQKCMTAFEKQKLFDLSELEQILATGLDEDYKKPKNILNKVVPLLEDAAIIPQDRLRLLMLYALYRDGMVMEDVKRLLKHSQLPQTDAQTITNLALLGARPTRELKEQRVPLPPLFTKNSRPPPPSAAGEEEANALSRYETAMQTMLEEVCRGTLDQAIFPYIKGPVDPNQDLMAAQTGSLRAGRPQWASSGRRPPENRQRIMVFMAGGATYSESRACYEMSARYGRDVFLITSHMITPKFFTRQLGDLSADKRKLDLPIERPQPKVPAYLYERPAPPRSAGIPPVNMPPGAGGGAHPAGLTPGGFRAMPPPGAGGLPMRPGGSSSAPNPPAATMAQLSLNNSGADRASSAAPSTPEKPHKDKKKRNFLGIRK